MNICSNNIYVIERKGLTMNIIEKRIDEIIPYEKNPRRNDKAVTYVVNSIKQFGFKVPLVIDKDNVIVCGHTRWKAAKRLKMKTLPCVIADDLTEEQIRAFRLADNKVAEIADWDIPMLNFELGELKGFFDFSDFGFDFSDARLTEGGSGKEAEEDNYEVDPPENPKAKIGDIYQLGKHRLMCGDSTNIHDVQKLMNGEIADLLLTDPPYGISVVKQDKIGGGGPLGGKKANPNGKIIPPNNYKEIIGDDTTETAKRSYEICRDVSKNQILFGGNYFTDFLFPSKCWIVWDKENTGNFADAELAWTSFDKSVKLYHYLWNGLCREGSREVEGKKRFHPTQKPVGLIGKILNDFSNNEKRILDLFGGSGSTLIACEQLGKECYMMEFSPAYVDVIIDRWEKFTGKKAVKIA